MPGQPVCTVGSGAVADRSAVELSGLVATQTGYVSINDSNVEMSLIKIFFFDSACKVKSTMAYPGGARDPEDMALGKDGTLWIADTGDNAALTGAGEARPTIALWTLAPGAGQKPVIHRLAYPDGKHDAEALILTKDDTPVIVTKEKSGTAGLYAPGAPLQADNKTGVALTKVGEFKSPATSTESDWGPVRILVTGGANSHDRKRVALRTYADAYEWDVPADGDAVKAITTGRPRITPLPKEPQGESLAYSFDDKSLLTVSDRTEPTPILRYTPTADAVPAASAKPGTNGTSKQGKSWLSSMSLQDITNVVAGVGVFGLVLVVIGIIAIRRSRASRWVGGSGAPARGAAPVGPPGPTEDHGPAARDRDGGDWDDDWLGYDGDTARVDGFDDRDGGGYSGRSDVPASRGTVYGRPGSGTDAHGYDDDYDEPPRPAGRGSGGGTVYGGKGYESDGYQDDPGYGYQDDPGYGHQRAGRSPGGRRDDWADDLPYDSDGYDQRSGSGRR